MLWMAFNYNFKTNRSILIRRSCCHRCFIVCCHFHSSTNQNMPWHHVSYFAWVLLRLLPRYWSMLGSWRPCLDVFEATLEKMYQLKKHFTPPSPPPDILSISGATQPAINVRAVFNTFYALTLLCAENAPCTIIFKCPLATGKTHIYAQKQALGPFENAIVLSTAPTAQLQLMRRKCRFFTFRAC